MQELMNQVPTVVGPDLVYIGLVIGLWLAVTAAYVPGTGVLEAVALVSLVGVLFLLAAMPTNWWAVGLFVVGVGTFLALPFVSPRAARFSEGGLVLQAVGGLALFHNGVSVSLLLLLLTVVLGLAYHRLILLPVLATQRQPSAISDDDSQLVGLRGRAMQDINPIGAVNVRSEPWTARSEKPIKAGEEIVVVARDGLELTVEKAKAKRSDDE